VKKILAVTPTLAEAGYHHRVGMFIPLLRERGFLVDAVRYPAFLERLRLFSRADGYDAVWIRRKMLDPLSAAVLRRKPRPVVFDFDDAIMVRSRERRGSFRSRSRERKFTRTVRSADAVLAGSHFLAGLARPLNPRVVVVPTGVDARTYPVQRHDDGPGRPVRLVWIGSGATLRFLMDQRGLLQRVARVWPQVRLRIICNRFPEWEDVPLEKVEWSPEIEKQALVESDIGISPLPDTPFTRGKCGLKLIQCMATGLPVIATPVGAHTEIVEDGVSGFVVDGEEAWLKAIGRLVEDRTLRQRMGHAARRRVEERYDVAVLLDVIASVFRSVTAV
jgi:glycosyltransferase involved in cell wall biosynthesis